MSTLIAITYDNEQSGVQAFNALDSLQKQSVLKLEDAAFVVKNQKGKVKVTQTLEKRYTGSVTTWGFLWGFLIGLIFGGPLFWGLFTALLSRIFGKRTDLGIDNQFIEDVGNSLDIGGSAVFMLVVEATQDKVLPELEKYGGHVYQTSLSNEDEEKLRKALEHGELKEAAADSLELEKAPAS
ncbi:MAG: DUF1269 domain-containing protein [Chloroflexi bacterium]|nr:DUF1269 domain-containing protein [Chloroflexota bacterium]